MHVDDAGDVGHFRLRLHAGHHRGRCTDRLPSIHAPSPRGRPRVRGPHRRGGGGGRASAFALPAPRPGARRRRRHPACRARGLGRADAGAVSRHGPRGHRRAGVRDGGGRGARLGRRGAGWPRDVRRGTHGGESARPRARQAPSRARQGADAARAAWVRGHPGRSADARRACDRSVLRGGRLVGASARVRGGHRHRRAPAHPPYALLGNGLASGSITGVAFAATSVAIGADGAAVLVRRLRAATPQT